MPKLLSVSFKTLKTLPLVASLAIAGTFATATPSFAIKGDYQRFQVCKQLKAENNHRWNGIASGTEDSTYSLFEHSRSFHTKACFSSEKACKTWVKRIWWEIPTMEELRTAYCRPA